MPMSDPVFGGLALVREEMRSPNYIPGVQGWRVAKDGTVEFNGGVFRGNIELLDNGAILMYNTPAPHVNNLVFAAAPAAGVDSVGNNYPAGLTLWDGTFGNQIINLSMFNGITLNGSGAGQKLAVTQAPVDLSSGGAPVGTSQLSRIQAQSGFPTGATETLKLQSAISGVAVDPNISSMILALMQSAGLDGAQAQFVFSNTGGLTTLMQLAKTLLTINIQTRHNEKVTISESNPGGALSIFQNVGTSTNPGTISIQETAAGNGSFATFVSGDAHARFVARASGQMQWGGGVGAADVTLQRTSAGLLELLQAFQVDGVLTATGGTATNPSLVTTDTWTAAALGTGWATIAGLQVPQYRLTADNMIEIVGGCQSTSATPSAVVFTLDANHLPATDQRGPYAIERVSAPDVPHSVDIGTGGAFTLLNNVTVSGRALYIYARIPKS